ncbi:MAG: hypothetical protein DRP83_04425 [Planctomycetota bacterium]|nr:MAG: hypothetical protein DRP83_04425 [Planctomycetota bacterium]
MFVAHITHEAVEDMGGIGTVIAGLTTSKAYGKAVSRTVLVGPLFSTDKPTAELLGPGGKILYSSLDEIYQDNWREKFGPIERTYGVGIIYGTRKIHEPYSGKAVDVEVLVFDLFAANEKRVNIFKASLYEKFDIPSDKFQNVWDFEQYIRLAEPAIAALKALGAMGERQTVLLSHEYMGMPTVLKAILDGNENTKTVFYAHEVASVRPIVENTPGHDTTFYNVMKRAAENGQNLEDIFPQVVHNYKHPLVKAARHCDHVFAVGEFVRAELEFLDSRFARGNIDLVYNGIPAASLTMRQKRASQALLQEYAANLFGQAPTWVFTHVARPVLSKAIWRDLRVLHELEPLLASRGERAVYFMLGTLGGGRRGRDVRHMERVYGWPVAHEQGYPDLCGGEEVVGEMCDAFNRTHEHSRAVLVNQWGWSSKACGQRMPAKMTIADLRRGCDLEFGMSVYEPFGISQLEPLSFGALCVPSSVCGCVSFAAAAMRGEKFDNIIEGNFLHLPGEPGIEEILSLSTAERDAIEAAEGRRLAERIAQLLPRDKATQQRRIETGQDLAHRMSWEHVVNEYFLPAIRRAGD